jgi:hypothetical protein
MANAPKGFLGVPQAVASKQRKLAYAAGSSL